MSNRLRDISHLIESIHDKKPVTGFTHPYYRYPARFSPSFAQAAIRLFTDPGDIVYDPFMGGGTTLVEAVRLHRNVIGTDLNSLAVFVARVKTTILTDYDISVLRNWVGDVHIRWKLNQTAKRPFKWIVDGYQKNISGRTTWPIRKILELALANIDSLANNAQRDFARCLLLKTAQWAVDCRKHNPSASDFRKQIECHFEEMIEGALEFRATLEGIDRKQIDNKLKMPICLHLPVCDIAQTSVYPFSSAPRLILTSPPYPGVHVLYHRWQVNGRKETPAPYWIANCHDGNGASFYTFGDRKQKNLEVYFENMKKSYKALAAISDDITWLVQLVAFSAPKWQLPLFLDVLSDCGFYEIRLDNAPNNVDGRVWRTIPNRKFYADNKGRTPSSKEVLLIHRRSAIGPPPSSHCFT